MKLQFFYLLLLISSSLCAIELTKDTYNKLIKNADKSKQKTYWLVEIYDPSTTNAEAIKYHQVYEKFSKNVRGAKAGRITVTEAKQICKEYAIYEFPTILFFDKNKFNARIYTGEHTYEQLMKFAIILTNQKGPNNRI